VCVCVCVCVCVWRCVDGDIYIYISFISYNLTFPPLICSVYSRVHVCERTCVYTDT